jgi:dynein heavy chain
MDAPGLFLVLLCVSLCIVPRVIIARVIDGGLCMCVRGKVGGWVCIFSFHYANSKRVDWITANLGMVGLVGSQCWWTWEVEDAFHKVKAGNKHGMKQLMARLTEQMGELVAEIRKPDISSNARKKINTLIIIDVHGKDIVDRFVRDSILDEREFAWESQLRFYWDRVKDDVVIRQCTGQFRYGYEFMGLNGRLVITPLTDRCYMTLTQALTFQMGGAPAGPAGTGKTETVKDLAKCLANPCFVTNCGEGLDYRAMGAIFSGLVQSGAWYAVCVDQPRFFAIFVGGSHPCMV